MTWAKGFGLIKLGRHNNRHLDKQPVMINVTFQIGGSRLCLFNKREHETSVNKKRGHIDFRLG